MITALRRGDESVLNDLLRACEPIISSAARAAASRFDGVDREELAQDCRTRIAAAIASFSFRSDDGLACWIRTIVMRAAWDQRSYSFALRRDGRRNVSLDSAPEAAGIRSPELSADELASLKELIECIDMAMSHLDAELSKVIRLLIVEGLTTREAAQRMHVSESRVRRLSSEAISQLSMMLSDWRDGPWSR